MTKIKRALSLFMVLAMLLSLLSVSAFAASEFSDMPAEGYWATQALKAAVKNGLLGGCDGHLMPKDELTRAQMAAIMTRAFGAAQQADISAYSDVLETAWYYSDIAKAVQMKLFSGSGAATMGPEKAITRQEVFVTIARALKLADGSETELSDFSDCNCVGTWAVGSLAALLEAGYIQGSNGRLRPTDTITREEFAQIMYNVLGTYCSAAVTYTEVESGNVMVNADGVTLKNLTISGDLIIGEGVGAGNVYLVGVTVTGRVIVRSGGENSIHVKNSSSIGRIIIAKNDSGNVRIVTEDGCSVEMVVIDDGKDDVILEGGFDSVSVTSNVPIVLRGANIAVLTMAAQDATVTLESGSITTAQLTTGATGAALEVAKGATVARVESAAENASITGRGTVKQAMVSGDNTTISTNNTLLAVSVGTSGVTENGNTVEGGTETTTQSSAGSGEPSGADPSPYYIAGVSTAAELESALSSAYASAIIIKDSFTLTGGEHPADLVLGKPVTILSGVTLTVGGNIKLCAESTLTNNGTIVLTGEATGHVEGFIGALVVCNGGALTNSGTITICAAACDSIRYDVVTDESGNPILDGDGNEMHINVNGPNGGLFRINGGNVNNYGTITAEQGALTAAANDGDQRYWGGYLEIANASTFINTSSAIVNFAGATLSIWADEGKALFSNSGTLNVTYGTVQIGGGGTLEVAPTGSLNNSSTEFFVGKYEYDAGTGAEETTDAKLLVRGSVINSGTITIARPGSNAFAVFATGGVVNTGIISNNGRINVMGVLDTSGGTITNDGHFFVEYTEGVEDIIGKTNISCINDNSLQFLAFDEIGLNTALLRGYTNINIAEEIVLSQDLTIPVGTKLTINEGGSLQAPMSVAITNNGSVYLALCKLAANEADQLQAELRIGGTLNNAATGNIQIAAIYDESENYSGGESVLWVTGDGSVTNSGTITNYGRITNVGSFTTTGTVTNSGHFFNLGTVTGTISGEPVIVPEP